ncbi:MAG: type II toxin-antitoxin system VapC family toxin [Terriglobia bacterium]
MSTYADTSFFVSLYIPDVHSPEAELRMASNPAVWLTPFHVAEWTHAVEQQVFRQAASRSEADSSYGRFQQHRESGLWVEVAMPESVFDVCAQLARRHGAKLGLRTLDTLHVASALELKAERFWTFDERQRKLARAVGLKTA